MTLNDFVKNQRGINGGGDFDRKYLEEIFNEIRNNEIVLKDEMTGELAEEYFWDELLLKSENEFYNEYECPRTGNYDREIFSVVWSHISSAATAVFDTTRDPELVQKTLEKIKECAEVSAHFENSEAFNKMVF
eukprot:Pgem_evm1s7779